MPLKVNLIGHDGAVLEQMMFSEVEFPRSIPDSAFQPRLDPRQYQEVTRVIGEPRMTFPTSRGSMVSCEDENVGMSQGRHRFGFALEAGEPPYELMRDLAKRADALKQVYPAGAEREAIVGVTVLVTSLAMNFVHRGAYFPEAPPALPPAAPA